MNPLRVQKQQALCPAQSLAQRGYVSRIEVGQVIHRTDTPYERFSLKVGKRIVFVLKRPKIVIQPVHIRRGRHIDLGRFAFWPQQAGTRHQRFERRGVRITGRFVKPGEMHVATPPSRSIVDAAAIQNCPVDEYQGKRLARLPFYRLPVLLSGNDHLPRTPVAEFGPARCFEVLQVGRYNEAIHAPRQAPQRFGGCSTRLARPPAAGQQGIARLVVVDEYSLVVVVRLIDSVCAPVDIFFRPFVNLSQP